MRGLVGAALGKLAGGAGRVVGELFGGGADFVRYVSAKVLLERRDAEIIAFAQDMVDGPTALAGLAEREQQPMRHEDGVVDAFDVAVGHRGPLTVEHVAEIVQQLGLRLERMRQGADGAGTVGDSRRCHRSGV